MKVSIVIPNWNGRDKLLKNLPKVLKTKGVDEVVVADDASSDDSVDVVKKNFPEVKLVVREKNGGFASNVNFGISHASGEIIFLLNSDAVPEVDCVEKALVNFKDPKVFAVSCNTGGNWSWAKFENGFFWHYMVPKPEKLVIHETLWASGGSSIFRKEIFDKLGGMDELFNPFYEEDVDLGYRARKRGYINIWDPESKVEHYKQVGVIAKNFSKKKVESVAQRNQLIFIWKNITSPTLSAAHQRALRKKLITSPKYIKVYLAARRLKRAIEAKRLIETREAKLTDEEILAKYQQL